MTLQALYDHVQWLAFRFSTYAVLNWMDDPALLAIVFC
ncbi:MAG: hypothetical protein JWQ72_926 [Polaromonas sp.]|nr:hypothetical protein [Polaromonas sp.]